MDQECGSARCVDLSGLALGGSVVWVGRNADGSGVCRLVKCVSGSGVWVGQVYAWVRCVSGSHVSVGGSGVWVGKVCVWVRCVGGSCV